MARTTDVRLSKTSLRPDGKAYTIGTLSRYAEQYEAMVETFVANGFGLDDCEFLFVDNRRDDQWDAFQGLNEVLNQAQGRYVILCHEDIRLMRDGRAELDARLAELTSLDPNWALAGNAGGTDAGTLAIRITDPNTGDTAMGGPFPVRVMSLDENFMVVRKGPRIGFSNDLYGFHLYGADLCLNAEIMGHSAYVIDFHLQHLSGGNADATFWAAANAFTAKWRRAFRRRTMRTTVANLPMEGAPD
ncbi:hypothetical protein [Mesorhizobium sp. ES1-4]|uniref:hypothetical protein n=1 Tax=Mesorhizobium sp. ES1-4 TaxID=2876627 RepID=UPI001CCEF5C9|nr:hypothetical protein [Mesorhizobium sp. ES1-4]MBZ9794136.1 hypothetical protein [Mesorhizobium sp. ES1-4]